MFTSKILFLIRGLPGSGKTTLALNLSEGTILLSADDYFYDSQGKYNFRPESLPQAHKKCLDSVEHAMTHLHGFHKWPEICHIAVHNTFSQPWEAKPYFELAKKHGFSVFVVECQNNFGSVHDVPQQALDNMKSRWLPLQ